MEGLSEALTAVLLACLIGVGLFAAGVLTMAAAALVRRCRRCGERGMKCVCFEMENV